MVSAAMIVFGYLGYRDMGISQFPELDFPVVNVTTAGFGAPIVSAIEDVISLVTSIVALLLPYLVIACLVVMTVVLVWLLVRKRRSKRAVSTT